MVNRWQGAETGQESGNVPGEVSPAPKFWSRPGVLFGAGAAGAALLLAACIGAWFLAQYFRTGGRPAGPSNSPLQNASHPAVADIERETERLRRELDEMQAKLRQAEAGLKPPVVPGAPTLADERDSLAKAIALDMARREDARQRSDFELAAESRILADLNALTPYESQRDLLYALRLPVVELELLQLDRGQLAARRAALEAATSEQAHQAAESLQAVHEALDRLDIDEARERVKRYLPLVFDDEQTEGIALVKQLGPARFENLLALVRSLPPERQQALAAGEEIPPEWLAPFSDPSLVAAVGANLPRVAAWSIALARNRARDEAYANARQEVDLTLGRKLMFLSTAFSFRQAGMLDPARARELIEKFGIFRLEGDPSLSDAGLVQLSAADEAAPPLALYAAYRQGKLWSIAFPELYDECRKLADDAWPPDDRPYPLAGHWASSSTWHVYIDPAHDEITFKRSRQQRAMTQRICKIGPDYLVAYEKRLLPGQAVEPEEIVAVDPFQSVTPAPANSPGLGDIFEDPFLLPYSDLRKGQFLVLTLYVLSKDKQKTIRAFRQVIDNPDYPRTALFDPQSDAMKSWGDVSRYRDAKMPFRYIDDRLSP